MTASGKTLNRMLYGFAVPVVAEVVGALLVMSGDSGAYAEGFAGIVILVMLIVAMPVTLAANVVIVPEQADDNVTYLLRGMILPLVFYVSCIIYYSGFWDKQISPYLPRHVEKIQTASGGRVAENTYESFFVVIDYKGTAQEQEQIEKYAREAFAKYSRDSRDYLSLNVTFYFVPKHLYDPVHDAVNRERAVALFRHDGADRSPTIKRVER